jgi:hypothetical protein
VFAALLGLPNVVAATIAVAVLAVVARRRVFGANERTETSWLDAWLKAVVIVVFVVFFTIYLPSYIIGTSTVADMNRNAQDLIAAGIWGVGMAATLGGLWYAHKEKRV